MRRLLAAAVVLIGLAALVGMFILRPQGDRPDLSTDLGFDAQIVDATVTNVSPTRCGDSGETDGISCVELSFDITSGPTDGAETFFEMALTADAVRLEAGDNVTLGYQPDNDPDFQYYFNDYQRRTPLLVLAAIFVAAVLTLGRLQGLRALVSLAVTGVVMLAFVFPSILDGHDPTAVALIGAAVIAIAALYLTHGMTDMITVALLGTFAALGLTAVLAAVFAEWAQFSGFASEDALYLTIASAEIDVRGLVLAGIVIGSLGVLDDVTVTQVSAVWQLHEANPSYGARRLYASAIVIGRDHIASTVNTLVLAYAGATLPLLLIFTQAGRSLGTVAEGELVAVEIVRALVGSIGLVAAVPLTTGLAALVVTRSADDMAQSASGDAARSSLNDEPPSPDWAEFTPQDPDGW
jgi:uncharacterized membrane protein